MSRRLVVLVDPAFRSMAEILDDPTRRELHDRFEVLHGQDRSTTLEEFRDHAARADAVVFGEWRHGSAGFEALGPNCRALLEVAGGHEHRGLDYQAALDRGLLVGSCAPAFGRIVAEHGLALALSAMRGTVAADVAFRAGTERWLHTGNAHNVSMWGATVGFVGCGNISRSLQDLLAPFGVTYLGSDPPMPDQVLVDRGIEPVGLDALFERSDVVFVLAPPTESTHHLVDRRLLSRLEPHQTLVLLSRGSLVDFDALVALLRPDGFRFATDVFPNEPPPPHAAIRSVPNAVRTPHLAGAMPAALHDIGRRVVDDLMAIETGRVPDRLQYLQSASMTALIQSGNSPRADTPKH